MTPTDLMSQCKRILNLDLNSKELGCLVVQMLEDDEANENAKRSKNSNAMLSTAALAANVEKELLGAEATEVAEDPEKVNEEAEDDNGGRSNGADASDDDDDEKPSAMKRDRERRAAALRQG